MRRTKSRSFEMWHIVGIILICIFLHRKHEFRLLKFERSESYSDLEHKYIENLISNRQFVCSKISQTDAKKYAKLVKTNYFDRQAIFDILEYMNEYKLASVSEIQEMHKKVSAMKLSNHNVGKFYDWAAYYFYSTSGKIKLTFKNEMKIWRHILKDDMRKIRQNWFLIITAFSKLLKS